jgi:hypothetical protein
MSDPNDNLLNPPALISSDEMCQPCLDRREGWSFMEMPSGPAGNTARTRPIPTENQCRVCGVRERRAAA